MKIDGQCHCGKIAYEAQIDPQRVSVCHCTDCQHLTGSPFRVSVLCARDDILVTAGEPRTYRKTGENGHVWTQHFCADCGSPIFLSGEGVEANEWGIRWGSIRQRRDLKPASQIWCRSAVPWLDDVVGLPGKETQ